MNIDNLVHIHYNASDFRAPDGNSDYWRNYSNPDSAKMFAVCCESWGRHGWDVRRVDSSGRSFEFAGKLRNVIGNKHFQKEESNLLFPMEFWSWWFIAKEKPGFYCTTDCINFGFTPEMVPNHVSAAISFGNTWTNTFCHVTHAFARAAISTIYSVDREELPMPGSMNVSDEQIVRDNLNDVYTTTHEIGCPINSMDQGLFLQHFSRSTLQRYLDSILVCT